MRVILTLICCLGLAVAQDGKSIADVLCAAIETGQAAHVLEGLEKGYGETLAEDLEGSERVCEAAARHARRFAKRDADTWRRLGEAMVALGALLLERNDGDATALTGHAEALLCRARVADALDDKPRPEDWRDAVECLAKAHAAKPGDGKRLVRAIRVAQEGASLKGADPALKARATELLEAGEKLGTKGPEVRAFLYGQDLRRITETIARDRKEAKKLVGERIEALGATLADQKDPPIVEATAYNDFVTLARSEKLGINAKYLARTEKIGTNLLTMDVPVSSRWKWRPGDLGTLFQYDSDGGLVRTVTFDTYSWEIAYTADGQEFGGDNLKGLARMGERDVLSVVVVPKSRKPLMRRRFNGRVPQCQAFEIGGLDKEGAYLKYTTFYFKAKEAKLTTFRVSLLDLGEEAKLDPEAEAVLDSIREPAKR